MRNLVISQWDRLTYTLCAAAFTALLRLHLDDILPSLSARMLCIPYYIAALLHLLLHYCKSPLKGACSRPSSPVALVPWLAILICFQVDRAFGPQWELILFTLGVWAFLALMLVPTSDDCKLPFSDRLICLYLVLVNITTGIGALFLYNLATLLNDPYISSVSYYSVLVPLIVIYLDFLACYIAAIAVLSRLFDGKPDDAELLGVAQRTRAAEAVLTISEPFRCAAPAAQPSPLACRLAPPVPLWSKRVARSRTVARALLPRRNALASIRQEPKKQRRFFPFIALLILTHLTHAENANYVRSLRQNISFRPFPPQLRLPLSPLSLQDDRLLELMMQHLGPPYLVQHSPTLFKRVEVPDMFATLHKQRAKLLPIVEGHFVSEQELGSANEGAASDHGRGAVEGGLAEDVEAGWGAGGRGESAAVCIECTGVPAFAARPAYLPAEAVRPQAGSTVSATPHKPWFKRLIQNPASIPPSDCSEYIQLQKDVEQDTLCTVDA
jgi:hypothetical protein